MQKELAELLGSIWTDLESAVVDNKNPFRTPVLGSINVVNAPSLRTVVLRAISPENHSLICYTDIRSAKVEELRKNPLVGFLFYDAERKIQLRATGTANVHYLDEVAKEHWQKTNMANRLAYMTLQAPGTLQNTPNSGLKEGLAGRLPTVSESEEGWPNFAVIISTIRDLDWVLLSSEGNRRAAFHWSKSGESPLEAVWLIP